MSRVSSSGSPPNAENVFNDYEKVKTVGKGSFGTATLYKRLADNLLVVMKHVHIADMSQIERNMALNEVQVISSLDHENIIRYLGSFETEGALVIIMEYASGGNLAQLIMLKKNNDEAIVENSILNIFSQICNGIGYMHAHKILHRDLKSANIFLTRDAVVKIGDFGISKMLNTRSEAQTVVGTPYYLSPEMCEGKDYNEKSDIWSLGCILYEMICLRKPFEAGSLPALVQKITSVDYTPIPETYSDGLHRLVQIILQKECDKRPSAQYIHQTIIPAIYATLLDADASHNKLSLSTIFNRSIPKERSVLYEMFNFTTDPSLHPVKLPHKRIADFSNSGTHFIVLTFDQRIYSWGENSHGQLGHGETSEFRKLPTYVDFFRGKNIKRCVAGESFSLFLAESGRLYSCGDGRFGCLGHGDWNSIAKPTLINALIDINITSVSCGATHVLALAANGKVYTWGAAKEGQLGLGSTQHACKPTRLDLPNDLNIREVYAGFDNSVLLLTDGRLLVAGSNMNNKLGLGVLDFCKRFVLLAGITERIRHVSLAFKHTALLTEDGHVLCMGSNQNQQCGAGEYVNGVLRVQNLPKIHMVTAGTCYTIAASEENVVYFWGTHYLKARRYLSATVNSDLQRSQNNNNNNVSEASSSHLIPDANANASGSQQPPAASSFTEVEQRFRQLKYEIREDAMRDTFVPIVRRRPMAILALYASPGHVSSGKILWLAGISANDNSLSVLVHTTAPPPIKRVDDDSHDQALLMNLNRTNRIYKNQPLPNTPI